ncbi:DNA-binding transcriptional regulator, MarR family [Actinacidiphila alni]|uniref:DNA-binding transcriptional regulator, MarR family n=1 Tax=Actinacidiphila alni TaxID=380248 RepID=A0A1I2J0Q2_9ACTN|nr:MarR family winged helix-turn-helix transcriptional regulator [Actinacidiphila alni]SFF47598.1 DNA-binding transcriptional regulator, MarR family [Actinacidiphila alni]
MHTLHDPAADELTGDTFIRAARAVLVDANKVLRERTGLAVNPFMVLRALSEAPHGRMTMNSLAKESETPRSRLAHTVAKLRGSGHLTTEENDGHDRRFRYAVITEKGRATVTEASAVYAEFLRTHVTACLSPAEVDLLRLVSRGLKSPTSSGRT